MKSSMLKIFFLLRRMTMSPFIQGYNAWPFNTGKPIDYSAILDTGANSTYVTDRRLLDNVSLPSHQSVFLADNSSHPIQSSGTLFSHPSIHADLVPTFAQNLISISPISANGALGIIQHDKMVQLQNHPYFKKLVNFAISYSKQNNLSIMIGSSQHGLYTTNLSSAPQAHMSMHTSHFKTVHDMVYHFYLVFNFSHLEVYCKLVSSSDLVGFLKFLTSDVVQKYYSHHDPVKLRTQLSKIPILNNPEKFMT